MALSVEAIQYLEEQHDEVSTRRGDEYGRFYGLLTATLEFIMYLLDTHYDHEDDDVIDVDFGNEAATVAEDWVGDFTYQVLDELYDCDTKEQFYAKFTPNCSLAWLYYWDVKYWEETTEAFSFLRSLNSERLEDVYNDGRPLPQWTDEM